MLRIVYAIAGQPRFGVTSRCRCGGGAAPVTGSAARSLIELIIDVKYPASSSYHLTRLVFMKTSSPRTFTAVLTLATARRCSFATGGTFSNSRALLQFTATLANNTTRERCENGRSSLKWVVQVQPDLTEICHAHE